MMKKLGVWMTAVLVIVSAQLYSQPKGELAFHKFIGELKLTDEQKKDVEKIRLDMEKQQIAQKAKNETARVELRQLFKADNPDRSAIEKKLNEIATLEAQMHMIKIDSWFAVNKLLTPEQQKTWKKALEAGPEMRQKMMKHEMMKDHKMGKGPMSTPQPAPQPPDAPSPK
jgi:Spy/CpxP family protein refolding chaperone